MITIREYYPAHTDFAEDLLGYPYGEPLVFRYENKCYVSAPINVDRVFLEAKKKWNYKCDEPYYFEHYTSAKEIKPYYIYYNIKDSVFIIPLEEKTPDDNIISFGVVLEEEHERLDRREKYIELPLAKGYKQGVGISDNEFDDPKYYSMRINDLLSFYNIRLEMDDIFLRMKLSKQDKNNSKKLYNRLCKYRKKLTKDIVVSEMNNLLKKETKEDE